MSWTPTQDDLNASNGSERTDRDARSGSLAPADMFIDGSAPVDISEYPGRLIVVEGTDNAGRSTQIALLREWLESRGFGVAHTALRRGRLASEGLESAKQGHTLAPITMDLFYATDFADRLDNFILPSLRAGFVVLTDRYVYSTMARSIVRGVDPEWIGDIYQFAPRPHASFYLKIGLEHLIPRVLAKRGFDYWESGLDFQEESDIFASFVRYQTRLLNTFDQLAVDHDLRVVDANGSIRDSFVALRDGITEVVSSMQGARV
ncbi:MAG: thymidylate kinase [Planctomycetota bacterium]